MEVVKTILVLYTTVLLVEIYGKSSDEKEEHFKVNESPFVFDPKKSELLYKGVGGKLNIEEESGILLSCPGARIVKNLKVDELEGTYKQGGIYINEDLIDLDDLKCTENLKENVIKTEDKCASGKGTKHRIGFEIHGQNISKIDVCFDEEKEQAIYTNHTIKGSCLGAAEGGNRPGFKGSNGRYHHSDYYKESSSKFKVYLKKDDGKSESIVKGHLVPDADFCIHNEAEATYYYINVVPQFQSNNNGNWKRIETRTRNYAEDNIKTLKVWTGVCGILKNGAKSLYLNEKDNKIPIPKFLWKVVCTEESTECVGFIVINSLKKEDFENKQCGTDCVNWIAENSEANRGQTYCCEVEQMKEALEGAKKSGGSCYFPDFPSDSTLLYYGK